MAAVERARTAAVLVSVGVAGNQAAAYLLNVAAARLLGPAGFGELGSLLAVLVVGAVPAMGLQTVTALRVARLREHGALTPDESGRLLSMGLATGAGVAVVTSAAAPLLMVLLHLDSAWPVLCVALSLASITMTGLCYGTLQGSRRFTAMAALLAGEGAGRIGGAVAGLLLFRNPVGALAGMAAGALVVACAGWVVIGRPRPGRGPHRGQVGEVLHAGQAMLALVLLVNLDLVLARHHLPAGQAGEYAVGAIVTKIAYWLPQAVAILVLPRLASAAGRRRFVPVALGVCAVLGAVVVLVCATMGPTVVAVIGGAGFTGSDLPVWAFATVGSLLSLVQILLFSRIAGADRRSALLIWAAAVLEIVLVTGPLHGGPVEVVTAALVATASLGCAAALVELRSGRAEPVDAPGHDGRGGQQ